MAMMRVPLLAWCIAAWCLASPEAWAEQVRSVMVRVIRLEAVPADVGRGRFAVEVSIGSKPLYRTPWAWGPVPVWKRSLRAFTAAGNPLVFEVMVETPMRKETGERFSGVERKPAGDEHVSQQDRVLATGFEEFVGDMGPEPPPVSERGEGSPPRQSEPREVRDFTSLCRAHLSWPPEDGEHRVGCGGSVLVVEIRRAADGERVGGRGPVWNASDGRLDRSGDSAGR